MKTAHVRCGDDLRDTLEPAGYAGDYIRVVDPVCQGPVPHEPDPERFDAIRAAWMADAYGVDPTVARRQLAAERAAVASVNTYDRVVLWFEHDWFDQAILIRLLADLADRPDLADRLWLMSINRFPGEERFLGYVQLSPGQLATLAGREVLVHLAHFDAARKAWDALRAPTPLALVEMAGPPVDGAALPFLAAAIERHLLELPGAEDGLSLSERLCLLAVAGGARTFGEIFASHQDADPQPYLGDAMLTPVLRRLTKTDDPALIESAGPDSGGTYALSAHGAAIVKGNGRWVSPPRWVGGVRVPA